MSAEQTNQSALFSRPQYKRLSTLRSHFNARNYTRRIPTQGPNRQHYGCRASGGEEVCRCFATGRGTVL